jgi:hypothetical protein
MEKRVERKKQRNEEFRSKLKKVLAIFFCIALLVFMINIIDMSTRRMIMCNDDKYALAVSLQEGSLLRLDIAGEKFIINIEPIIRVTDYIVDNSKKYLNNTVEFFKNKL